MSTLPETYTDTQLKQITQNFIQAFEFTRPDQPADGISTLINPLPPQTLVDEGEKFQIMVIGGSTLRTAHAHITDGTLHITNLQERSLPLLETRETFLSVVESHLSDDVSVLALNYSFPLKAYIREDRLDGTAFRSVKRHALKDLIDSSIGQEIEKYVNATRSTPLTVTCAHDTTCLLLAGSRQLNRDKLIGGVVGTGVNFARLESGQVINFESGNFYNFEQTSTGQYIDEHSDTPGSQQFEKEVSGAFLPLHYNRFIDQANLNLDHISSAKELDDLAAEGSGQARDIARRLLRRSANLTACQMAALFHVEDREQTTFLMEGSLFWQGWKYRSSIIRTLKTLGVPPSALQWKELEDSSLHGGGHLVLANQ